MNHVKLQSSCPKRHARFESILKDSDNILYIGTWCACGLTERMQTTFESIESAEASFKLRNKNGQSRATDEGDI